MDRAGLYRDVVESSPDGIWVVDLEGTTLYGNPRLAELFGVPRERLGAIGIGDLPDVECRARLRERLTAVADGLICDGDVEVRWPREDAADVWTLAGCTLLHDASGRPSALRMRFIDFTERRDTLIALRASEDALRDQVAQNELMAAVVSAANEAATLVELLRRARDLVLVHDDWERARAYLVEDGEPVLLQIDDQIEADARDPLVAGETRLARRCLERGAPTWDERRLTLAFPVVALGETHAVLVITSAPPLYRFEMIESMAVRIAAEVARVVERETVQATLARARDEAEAASQQKSDFLATMSHEIRTPLNGVIGLNDLLLRSELNGEQLRLATGVQVASRALLGVINDILDFSKIEAGRLELEEVDFEVRALLDQVAGVLAEAARSKGLDLVVSCHRQVPALLRGDPTRLAQVITNLVSNAVKFTERGGVIVRAMAVPEGASMRLSVEVSDTGIGIPSDDVASLFDPFTQADASTTRLYGGTGLGLAIAREIVEAMGGGIRYAPNLGGGSVFTFSALLSPATGADPVTEDARARAQLEGIRALVVDDTEHNRIIVEEQLGWWGVVADTAASAEEALALLERDDVAYDVVLLDLAMPQRDGLDLARTIRARPDSARLPLLMLTSVAGVGREALAGAGIDDVLTKPVLASVLRTALLGLLAEPASRPVPRPATETTHRGRVLVVEDNQVNQLVATGLLRALGYDALTADDGRAAVPLALDPGIDAVLMDIQMPRMDGYAATRAIRSDPAGRRKPIIAMTAAAIDGERDRCLAAGMDDFLTKPVDSAALGAVLAHWLDGAAMPAETPPTLATSEPAVVDHARLAELDSLDDGEAYLDRAVDNFLASAPTTWGEIAALLDAGDPAAVRALAHKLAGSALNLGATRAGLALRDLEERARADDATVEGLRPHADVVGSLLQEACEELGAYRRSRADRMA